MKKCFKCNIKKELTEFYKHPQMPDGTVNKCKECNKKDVRNNFAKNREHYKEYDKERIRNNFDYIFLHRYSGILARIQDRAIRKYKVSGMDVASKEDFIKWCWEEKNLKAFKRLHDLWRKSGYKNSFVPSIDRIDEGGSYTLDNIQWLSKLKNIKKYYKK